MFFDVMGEGLVSDAGLVAIDVGLSCGLARFDAHGALLAVRAARFPRRGTLRRGALAVLRDLCTDGGRLHAPGAVVVEGDPRHARAWMRAAEQLGARAWRIDAPVWRRDLLGSEDQRDGATAKAAAMRFARPHIEAAGVQRAGALTDDVAEAVCIGVWAMTRLGQDTALP